MTTYCVNGPCENEATRVVIHSNGEVSPLCFTCASAYEMGQQDEAASVVLLESDLYCCHNPRCHIAYQFRPDSFWPVDEEGDARCPECGGSDVY